MGHFVGMPDEVDLWGRDADGNFIKKFPCIPDPIDATGQNTVNCALLYEAGYWNYQRLDLCDWEKCWFQHLYCPPSTECGNIAHGGKNSILDNNSCSDIVEAVQPSSAQPDQFELISIIPNPSHSHTTINFSLTSPSHINIELFDVLGKSVRLVSNKFNDAGTSTVEVNLGDLPSGSYYARIQTGGSVYTYKIIKED